LVGRHPAQPLIEQPLRQAVWGLALPAMGSMMLRYANIVVDQYWVGHLPEPAAALAGVGASNFLMWAVFSLGALFTTGLQAYVARAVGAGDRAAQADAARHGLALAGGLGVIVALLGLGAQGWVHDFQRLSPEVREASRAYLTVLLYGLPATYLGMGLTTIFQAEGDTRTPFRVGVLGLVINTALDPLFIMGWGPLPAMGIAGSALVTVAVQVAQAAALGLAHHRRPSRRPAEAGAPRVPLSGDELWRFVRLGLPVAASGVAFSSIYIALVRILAPYGDPAVAALGLGHTIEGFPHFACVGFGAAAATLVGQNLGAGRPHQAEAAAWRVVGYLTLLLVPVALVYGTLAPHLLRLFMAEANPEVIAVGTAYLRMAAAVQVFGGLGSVLSSALIGAGETTTTTAIGLGSDLLRVPVGAALAGAAGLGPTGVWLGIGLTVVLKAAGWSWQFHRGRWKSKRI
jgi:putative MATE family efflux protein